VPTAELAFDVGVQEVELLDWREGQAFLFHFLRCDWVDYLEEFMRLT
jgi:hypothetical protein